MVNLIADITGALLAMVVYSLVMYIYYIWKDVPKDIRRSRVMVSALIFGVMYFIVLLILDIS